MTVFFDTNVLIYRIVKSDPRQPVAQRLLLAGGSISVQVLNEFASVVHRKMGYSWAEVQKALAAVRSLVQVSPITVATHEAALELADQHNFSFYDGLIVAAALKVRCSKLYTEDMQHGMRVRQSLEIVNPFVVGGPSQ